ncbi:MAG: helix-turn-helix transcriptional regulator [Solirubrobacteraceae bacterium]
MSERAARKTAVRPMKSPVHWALLGLVIDRSSYGLELAKRFERVYGEVLPVSGESHVYYALDTLQARGMIEMIPGTEVGRQPKPHYRPTAVGIRSYEDWLVAQVDAERLRQELWVRQLAVFVHDPDAALNVIGRFERAYLKGASHAGRSQGASAADSRDSLIDGLVSEHRRLAVGGMLSWLRYAHDSFEALARKPPVDDPS